MSREIEVWADWQELGSPILMGHLRSSLTRGKEIFSFSYEGEWLASGAARQLDPDLRPNFGLFLDSSPDRWGRLLMQRREAALAREANRPVHRLQETDYLLGVHDEQRSGALRFKERETGDAWLNNESSMRTPPWTSLRELEQASWKIQDASANDDPHYLEWLNLLIAPGSSIGQNVCGVTAGAFDRVRGSNGTQRVHFASAMTLLGHTDGDNHHAGASYLEIVEFLCRQGAATVSDLAELWRRIVFSIAVRNTDDHLRNHGFLLTDGGWILSPAYDLNPEPTGAGLSLNISENDNTLSFDLAMEVASLFRLNHAAAEPILREVKGAVGTWKKQASDLGIARAEQEIMAAAFEA